MKPATQDPVNPNSDATSTGTNASGQNASNHSYSTRTQEVGMAAAAEMMVATARKAPVFKGSSMLFGSAGDFAADPLTTLLAAQREYGDMVATRFAHLPVMVVAAPADIQRVLVDNRQNYTKTTYPYQILRNLLGNGLVTSEGSFWLRQRRIAQPAFQRERINAFAGMITTVAQDMATLWADSASRREVREVLDDMTLVTLRVAGFSLISQDLKGVAGGVGAALTVAQRWVDHRLNALGSPPLFVPTARNRAFKKARAELFGLIQGVIAQRRADKDPSTADLLGMLMTAKDPETGESMSDAQLADELLTILMAGHETTSNMLTWTLYRLSLHPEVTRRLLAELQGVLGGRSPTVEDIPRLPYLDAVFKETMRLHPPVWILDRMAEADDVLGGCLVKKGTTVITSPYLTHRHPGLWRNPEGFDPDRWFTPEVKSLHRLAYFPFSVGQRKCVGDTLALLEAPIILATLLQAVTPELVQGHKVEPETLVTMRPKYGMRMVMRRTEQQHAALPPASATSDVAKEAAAAGCPFHAKAGPSTQGT
jgi:cytochrome P450